jgi:hypothetical protein
MPQKTPANSSRRASPGSYISRNTISQYLLSSANYSRAIEQSIETLKETNAALAVDRDRYRQRNEKLQDKLYASEQKFESADRNLRNAKEEIKRLVAELNIIVKEKDTLEKGFKQVSFEKETMTKKFIRLEASFDNLKLKYDAIPEERRNPMTAALPERPHRTATSTSTSSGGSGGSSRAHEAERGRQRQADKERLATRFETTRRPPLTGNNGNRNSSYIEGYGPRRRSGSAAAPSSRVVYDNVTHTGRLDEPLVSPRDAIAFSQVPRSMAGSGGYRSGGSSAVYDDYEEDGDYHIRPVQH